MKEKTRQRSYDVVGSDRARSSGLATSDAPADHDVDLDRLDPCIGGELKSTAQMGIRVDPHRHTGPDVLDENLVIQVLVNLHAAILEEDRETFVCHLAPPFVVGVWDSCDTVTKKIEFLSYCVAGKPTKIHKEQS